MNNQALRFRWRDLSEKLLIEGTGRGLYREEEEGVSGKSLLTEV